MDYLANLVTEKNEFYHYKLKLNLIILFQFILYIRITDINKKTALKNEFGGGSNFEKILSSTHFNRIIFFESKYFVPSEPFASTM